MKQNTPLPPTSKMRLTAASFCAALLALGHASATTLIDLSRPVSESLDTVTGIYWNFDAVYSSPSKPDVYNMIQDSSVNQYTSYLDPLETANPLPSLSGGVDRAETSGFGNGISFKPGATGGNPRAYTNLPVTNNLAMVNTSFTGGVWLKLDSVNTGSQRIILMDRGGLNRLSGPSNGVWAFYLEKNAAGNWLLAFQSNDGVQYSNGFNNIEYQPFNLQDGEWHHLGFSFEYRPEEANLVTFWLDGVSVGTALLATDVTSGSSDATTRRFSVGERATSSWQSRLNGSIDDLFVTTGLYGFQPIPEPGTYALLGIGLTFSLALQHRKRRAAACPTLKELA